ncbi:MAG: outer membrane protein transport protein [Deltaproteobacteria bacterium]|nr:outer membrane protein transport protein [Deltaproteobacteria bacterium]
MSLGAATALVTALTVPARAGGFGTAQFGGTHGNAASDSVTSIFYNPAGLALGKGTQVYVEGLFAYRSADYTRDPGAIDRAGTGTPDGDGIAANSGAAKLRNTIASPFLGAAVRLGKSLTIAAGVYVPFGGQAKWGQVDTWKGNQQFPGAYDGPQRWSVTEGEQRALFYTLAAAYSTPDKKLMFGAGLNLIQGKISLTRARNITGTDDLVNPDGSISEGRSLIEVDGFTMSASLGMIARVSDDTVVGVSYQSAPIPGGQNLDGTLTNQFGATAAASQKVQFRQELPDSLRGAVDWHHGKAGLRGSVEYTRWSAFKEQCLVDSTAPASCQFLPSGALDTENGGEGVLVDLPRNWGDNFAISVGGSYWPSSSLELSANLKYDSNAIPNETLEPALMDADKLISMVGARWTKGKIMVDLSLANVAYATRTTTPRGIDPAAPSRNPDMAGTFKQSVTFALLGLGFSI